MKGRGTFVVDDSEVPFQVSGQHGRQGVYGPDTASVRTGRGLGRPASKGAGLQVRTDSPKLGAAAVARLRRGDGSPMKRNLFAELKRRNVLRAAVLYIGGAWALAQGISELGPAVGAPEWFVRWFLVAAAIGFPFFMAFAWFYELTPEGLKRESEIDPAESVAAHAGHRMDRWIFAAMGLVIVLLLTNTFVWHKGTGLSDGAEGVPAPVNSVAVLPFEDMSRNKDQGYFADGISEDLLNLLTEVAQLQVTARTSSFAFKHEEVGVREIARRLHVAHILQGSVQKAGDQVRITVQLVDAATDRQRWSHTYDRTLDNIFRIQDEIAGEVVKALKVELLGAAPTARETDPAAYALHLQAKQLGRQWTAEAFARSDSLYRQVLDIDPRYAPAWDGLAQNFINERNVGLLSAAEAFGRAAEAEEKVLAIDPDYAPAHARLGWMAIYADSDFPGAAEELQRALVLDSTDLGVLGNAATFLQDLGRVDEALALKEAIVRRDPVNVSALYNLANAQRVSGHYDEAIATYHTVLGLSPDRGGAHALLGITLLLDGDVSAALAEIEQEQSEIWRMLGLPMAHHAAGRDPDPALAALIARYGQTRPYRIAWVHAFIGEADQAFEWLDRAIAYRDSGLAEIVPEILFENIHADPRWVPLLRTLGRAPDQLAAIDFEVPRPGRLAQPAAN